MRKEFSAQALEIFAEFKIILAALDEIETVIAQAGGEGGRPMLQLFAAVEFQLQRFAGASNP
jgi:hypothetical protein